MTYITTDLEDIGNFDVSKLSDALLRDKMSIAMAWYCKKKRNGEMKFSFQEILKFLGNIVHETHRRGKTKFHPGKMKPCSREAFFKVAPKEYYEEPKLWGMYLVKPHGKLIHSGKKTMVVKSVPYKRMDEKLYVVSGDLCYGEIEFNEPKKIDSIEEFERLESKHRITKSERKKWCRDLHGWCAAPYHGWTIKNYKRYDKPKKVQIPKGIQVFASPKNIKFIK